MPRILLTNDDGIGAPGLRALEAAMAAKKVILSAEEIVDPLEFRKDPARTTIPYFLADAVVHLPFRWPEEPRATKWGPDEPSPIVAMMLGGRERSE